MFIILTGTFFTISSGDVSTMLGYTGNLIADLLPIILPLLGISIALAIWRNLKK
jgi:hypothetical protein